MARYNVVNERPYVLIGSPSCTAFCVFNQGLNRKKMAPDTWEAMMKQGRLHLHCMISIYREQLAHGRHFLHEHPASASAWQDNEMVKLLDHPRVTTCIGHQCQYGLLTTTGDGGTAPAKKPIGFLTNSPQAHTMLSKMRQGGRRHVHLVNGRARAAEV